MTLTVKLTENQQRMRDWIAAFIAEKGYSPTMPEIAAAFGISTVRVLEQIRCLERAGALRVVGRKLIQIADELPLTKVQRMIVNLFRNPVASQRAAASLLGMTPPSLNEHLKRLKEIGALEVGADGKIVAKLG